MNMLLIGGAAALVVAAGIGYAGYDYGKRTVQSKWDQQIILENADRRAREQAAGFAAGAIRDQLSQTRLDLDRATTLAADRLRKLAEVRRASDATARACRDSGAPAVAVIRDETREDLIGLARDANAISARLQACQRWVTEVTQNPALLKPKEP